LKYQKNIYIHTTVLGVNMDTKSKVIKRKSGKSKGKWIVRISYFDTVLGKKRYIERHAGKKGKAVDIKNSLVDKLKRSYGQSSIGEKRSFNDLLTICR